MYTVEIRPTMYGEETLRRRDKRLNSSINRNEFTRQLMTSAMAKFPILVCALCLVSISSPNFTFAQDPFSTPHAAGATQATDNTGKSGDLSAPARPRDDEPIITAIRQSNPQTDLELAKAIQVMLDINRDEEALRYLNLLAALNQDDEKWHLFHQTQGPGFLVKIQHRPGLQPAGKQFADRIFAIARKMMRDVARLNSLVNVVLDGEGKARVAAASELISCGGHGAAALTSVFADSNRSSSFGEIGSLIKSMGSSAEPVLVAAARSQNVELQKQALKILPRFKGTMVEETLFGTFARARQNQEIRSAALKGIGQRLRLSEAQTANAVTDQLVAKKLRSYVDNYLNDSGIALIQQSQSRAIWFWNEGTRSFDQRVVPVTVFRRAMASDLAIALMELDPNDQEARFLASLTGLEANRMIIGVDQPVDSLEQIGLDAGASTETLSHVLAEALKRDLRGAAISACDGLGFLGDKNALTARNGHRSPLARALEYGCPRIRFAAAQAVIRIDPDRSFAGSSRFVQSLVYMAGSMGYSKVMIAHHSPRLSQTFAAGIEQTGRISHSVNSSRDCFRDATQDSDVDFIFITDTLDRPDYAELIQQLRHDPRTRKLPIGLLARPENMRRAEIIASRDKLTIATPWTREPASIARILDRLEQMSFGRVERETRLRYAKVAMDALQRYAADRKRYSMYDLESHQQSFANAMFAPGVAEQACEILGNLGSAFAQTQLLDLANQTDQTIEMRQKAVESFASAVKNRGTMLTTFQITKQRNRYRSSLQDAEEHRKILSDILDIIENRGR